MCGPPLSPLIAKLNYWKLTSTGEKGTRFFAATRVCNQLWPQVSMHSVPEERGKKTREGKKARKGLRWREGKDNLF